MVLAGLLARWLVFFSWVFTRVLSPFPTSDTPRYFNSTQPHPEGEACIQVYAFQPVCVILESGFSRVCTPLPPPHLFPGSSRVRANDAMELLYRHVSMHRRITYRVEVNVMFMFTPTTDVYIYTSVTSYLHTPAPRSWRSSGRTSSSGATSSPWMTTSCAGQPCSWGR